MPRRFTNLGRFFAPYGGRRQYLWRAVDQDGDVIDILMQPRHDRHAAARFFRKLLKGQGRGPRRLITDKLGSYGAAHRFKSVRHAQRFLSVHGLVQNLFRVGRHLLRAVHHRFLRTRSFRVWDAVTCARIGGLSHRRFGGGASSFDVNLTVPVEGGYS